MVTLLIKIKWLGLVEAFDNSKYDNTIISGFYVYTGTGYEAKHKIRKFMKLPFLLHCKNNIYKGLIHFYTMQIGAKEFNLRTFFFVSVVTVLLYVYCQ